MDVLPAFAINSPVIACAANKSRFLLNSPTGDIAAVSSSDIGELHLSWKGHPSRGPDHFPYTVRRAVPLAGHLQATSAETQPNDRDDEDKDECDQPPEVPHSGVKRVALGLSNLRNEGIQLGWIVFKAAGHSYLPFGFCTGIRLGRYSDPHLHRMSLDGLPQ
jgi:hypothetical protein